MKEKLTQYVDLLFAGTQETDEIRQEILQNTLDRYDDLIDQGKSPEAAYRLAITSIGDVSALIQNEETATVGSPGPNTKSNAQSVSKKILRAIGIFLYILCPIPLVILSDLGLETIGLCGTLAIVAVATVFMILGAEKNVDETEKTPITKEKTSELRKAIKMIISVVGLCSYFIISFNTGMWHITWLIFLIMAAAQKLAKAVLDLLEVK